MKIPKQRHNLRYKAQTWQDLAWLAEQLETTITEVMEEALNRGLSWVAEKNGYKLPSVAACEIRKRKLDDERKKARREDTKQAHMHEPIIPHEKEPEKSDEEIEQDLNEMFRDLESKHQGRELTMEEYLQGVKDGKWN